MPEHRSFDAEPLQLAIDLDGAAVAGAEPARHRRFPGELRVGRQALYRTQHWLRAACEDFVALSQLLQGLGDEDGVDDDLGVRNERCSFSVPLAPEPEQGRRLAELLRQ